MLSLLPEPLAARLRAAGVAAIYGDGETIHSRGDARPGLSIVRSGAVRFAIPGVDGSYISTSVLGPGHCFGEATLFAGLPRTHDAVAVGETVIDQIPKSRFDRLLDDEPLLARKFLEMTTERLYAVLDLLDDLRRLPLPVRAAKLIAGMARSARRAGEVECNQADLAFTLGVSRVSIGKALALLAGEGLITLGYGRIGVADRQRLLHWIADRSPIQPLPKS